MPDIRYALSDEREEVVQFYKEAFPRVTWADAEWQALVDGRWSAPDDPIAVTVREGGALIGVLGLISARRPTAGGMVKTTNLTSWYLLKPYRGGGIGSAMLAFATSDATATITNLSSARRAVPVVERAGFAILDRERLIWRARPAPTRWPVHTDPLRLGDALAPRDRRVLADHAGLNLRSLAVETPEGLCTLILSVKQKHDDRATHEVMYIGDRALFARHARRIADSILPAEAAELSVDRRFVAEGVTADALEPIPVPRFYTAGRMAAADVDHLYSEIVLLDLKMY